MCWTVSEIVIIVTNTCLASGGTEAKTVCDGPYPLQLLIIVALKQVVLIVSDNVPTATLYFLEGVDTSGCDESVGGQVSSWQLFLTSQFFLWVWLEMKTPQETSSPRPLQWESADSVQRSASLNVVMNHWRLEFHRLFAIWFNVSSRILMNGLHSWHSDWINQRNIITVEIDVQLKTRITKLNKDKKVKYTLSYNYKGSMWIKSRDDSSKSSSFMFCCPLCPLCSLDCYCPLLAVQWYQPVVHHVDIEPVLSSAQWVSCALMFVYTLNMHCVLPQWVHTVYTAHNSLTSCFYNTVQW